MRPTTTQEYATANRIALVTGAASGIGQAIVSALRANGRRVIGVDIAPGTAGGDITADLGLPAGRSHMLGQARELSDGRLDEVYACAGVIGRGADTLSVNFFGAAATLSSLLPLLQKTPAPRAVAIGSVAGYNPADEPLIAACLGGQEDRARRLAVSRDELAIYSAAKTALARWCRRHSVTQDWAGAGVLLNVIAPGLVETGMNRETFTSKQRRAAVASMMPCPLGRHAQPEEIAGLALYLGSPLNSFVTGQVIYCDGGQEAWQPGSERL